MPCFFLVISEIHVLFGLRMNENDVSLADCATTHTILRDKRLYSNKSRKNLLSFKDIRRNGYHIESMNEENVEYLYITFILSSQKLIMEKLPAFSFGLHHTTIKPIESYVVVNQNFNDPKFFVL